LEVVRVKEHGGRHGAAALGAASRGRRRAARGLARGARHYGAPPTGPSGGRSTRRQT